MRIPVAPGPLTLYYPKWIPGEHAPSGPVGDLVGLIFKADGKVIPWKRDPRDMFAFVLTVPPGVNHLDVTLDYVSPTESSTATFTESVSTTDKIAVINWNQLLLYPKAAGGDGAGSAGDAAKQVQVSASLKLPEGWNFGTALPATAVKAGSSVQFATASLAALIDSPVLAGRYFKTVPLQPGRTPAHQIDIAADSESATRMTEPDRQAFNNLVAEAGAMFGTRPYRQYRFLVALSNHLAHFGLEHHESSDIRLYEQFLTDPAIRILLASMLPHEFVHAWNGKYRVPAEMAAPDFQSSRKTGLLWVYEGLTSYLSMVLTARSGLWTAEQFREQLSTMAMSSAYRPGRQWRPLQDTAVSAQLLFQAPPAWSSWRRGPDFYDDGALIWLEADVIIRRQTHNRKSLDDFACLFFAGEPKAPAQAGNESVYTSPGSKTYTFDDVVNALNQISPYDWRRFFDERVDVIAPAPLSGITQAGWLVVYTEAPTDMLRIQQDVERVLDATASIGVTLQPEGQVLDTVPGMAAALAGIGPGMRVVAVNGRRFSPRVLLDALHAGLETHAPLQLLIENAEYYKSVSLDYYDGIRYPHLARDPSRANLLADILEAKAAR